MRAAITTAWARDEATHVTELLAAARRPEAERRAVQATATDLVQRVLAELTPRGL